MQEKQNQICAECSVCYGGSHRLPDGFLLADSRRRPNGKPYRLDEGDHCVEGTSPVVELPVSGGFGNYWEPDGIGGFNFFDPIASDTNAKRQMDLFQKRLKDLSSSETDIFHIHFHLYEFLGPNQSGAEKLGRAGTLLKTMANDERVRFDTPSGAVEEWDGEKK